MGHTVSPSMVGMLICGVVASCSILFLRLQEPGDSQGVLTPHCGKPAAVWRAEEHMPLASTSVSHVRVSGKFCSGSLLTTGREPQITHVEENLHKGRGQHKERGAQGGTLNQGAENVVYVKGEVMNTLREQVYHTSVKCHLWGNRGERCKDLSVLSLQLP